jgi:hypothetical protein
MIGPESKLWLNQNQFFDLLEIIPLGQVLTGDKKMNLNPFISFILFCFLNFVFTSEIFEVSSVAHSVENIHKSLTEGKNDLLAAFLTDLDDWDTLSERARGEDRQSFISLFKDMEQILCLSAEDPDSKCMVKLLKAEKNYTNETGEFLNKHLKDFVGEWQNLWEAEKKKKYSGDETMQDDDLVVLFGDVASLFKTFLALLGDKELKDITLVPLKTLTASLAKSFTHFKQDNWKGHEGTFLKLLAAIKGSDKDKGDNQDDKSKDIKVDQGDKTQDKGGNQGGKSKDSNKHQNGGDNKDGNGDKNKISGPDDQPMSFPLRILLFVVLPLLCIIIIFGVGIYLVKRK